MIRKLTLALLGILCIASCGNTTPTKPAVSPVKQQPTEQPTMIHFHVNIIGTSGHTRMTFDARQPPQGIILQTWEENDKHGLITRKADGRLLNQIDDLVKKHNSHTWNGQYTDSTHGAGYDIMVQYTDKKNNIGSSCFGTTPPPGMEAFWQDLYALREQSLKQYKEEISNKR